MPATLGDLQLWKAKSRRAAITQNVPAGNRFTALEVTAKFKVLNSELMISNARLRVQTGSESSMAKWTASSSG